MVRDCLLVALNNSSFKLINIFSQVYNSKKHAINVTFQTFQHGGNLTVGLLTVVYFFKIRIPYLVVKSMSATVTSPNVVVAGP